MTPPLPAGKPATPGDGGSDDEVDVPLGKDAASVGGEGSAENYGPSGGAQALGRGYGGRLRNSLSTVETQFQNLPKRRSMQITWILIQIFIFPYFVSSLVAAENFSPNFVFSLFWFTVQAVIVGVFGWLHLSRIAWQTPKIYGAITASCTFMSLQSLNTAIDVGAYNSPEVSLNVYPVRATIAFAVFLFLFYSLMLLFFYCWGTLLRLDGGSGNNEGLSDYDQMGLFREDDHNHANQQYRDAPTMSGTESDFEAHTL